MLKAYFQTKIQQTLDYWDGEQYGDWSEEYCYNGVDVYANQPGGDFGSYTGSVETDFELKAGHVVFPVIVQYSSGNSFGTGHGYIHLVGVYETADEAYEVVSAIEANGNSMGHITVRDKDIYTGTWTGYFEHLERVFVETEVVRA